MGCDIHLVIEKRHPDIGWVGLHCFPYIRDKDNYISWPATNRNYRLFAALAGVRGDGPEPKGIPLDASELTQMTVDDWRGDGHSHSWLPLHEAIEEFNKRRYPGESPVDPTNYRDRYPSDFWFGVSDDQFDDYRLIFWFDN